MPPLHRRAALGGLAAGFAGGLKPAMAGSFFDFLIPTPTPKPGLASAADPAGGDLYGPVAGEPFPLPRLKPSLIRKGFARELVPYATAEAAGTIVIDPRAHYLYLVRGDGLALRYGVGVGRQGFAWRGEAVIKTKQAWPDWYPPKEMIERTPALARSLSALQSGVGMRGGPGNPLGARALYLWQGNKDTLFRIHGTTEPRSIGTSASSGCIRMINQDAIDLYGRVPEGTRVIVL